MSLTLHQIHVDGYDNNLSYVIADTNTNVAAIVDPCGDIERVFELIEEEGYEVHIVLVTHTHHDHIDRIEDVLDSYPETVVYAHEEAEGKLRVDEEQTVLVADGEMISIGDGLVEVLHTPGHSDDSICFLIPEEQEEDGLPKLLSGDTVFVEGCGRTNSAGVEELYESIQRIKELAEETEIFPGHDYGSQTSSTVEREKEENKYFVAEDFEEFRELRLG